MAAKKSKKVLGKKDMRKTKGGEINQIISPRDPATGQASGKRQYGAISITKEWDASTP